MIALELLWWIGLGWFAAWTVLPLALVGVLGPVLGVIAWAILAPWSALVGMVAVHRLLPAPRPGRHRMFADPDSVRWALKGWAPSIYLTVFQPLFFQSSTFQRLVLRAFQARVLPGATVTSRTIIREPHLVRIGRGSLIGEFAHLVTSLQLQPRLLVVGAIEIGDGVLIGGYCHLAAGARVGDGAVLKHEVNVGPGVKIGAGAHVGAGTTLYTGAQVGDGAIIGNGCLLAAGVSIPAGARIPDGTVLTGNAP